MSTVLSKPTLREALPFANKLPGVAKIKNIKKHF